jgi:hypothetical protein
MLPAAGTGRHGDCAIVDATTGTAVEPCPVDDMTCS